MAFSFPSPALIERHVIDVAHMHECLAQWRDLPTRADAISDARFTYDDTFGTVTGAERFVLMADDTVALAYAGCRGGFRVIHNFGKAA